jgi:hypothetical protein
MIDQAQFVTSILRQFKMDECNSVSACHGFTYPHGFVGMGQLGVGWGLIFDTHAKPIPI